MEIRDATPGDAEAIARTIAVCFDGYREFAPAGWEPPSHDLDPEPLRERLGQPWLFCQIAVDEGQVAGHVGVMPSERSGWPERRPDLAHFWQLFVRPAWWGGGAGRVLHARAVADTAGRGFTELRLYTPAQQARARRFYEREGWTPRGEPFHEPRIGFPVIEYRRAAAGG